MTVFNGSTTGDEIVKTFQAEAKGKTVLITGPSQSSIGGQTVLFLAAAKPKLILLAGRNLAKIQPVIDEIKKKVPDVPVIFVKLDLADQSSVREAAKQVNSTVGKLDILINNAGIMAVKDYTTTAEGIEVQFGVNHIGHFLLTNLLMPKILAAGNGSRIVNVSSIGYIAGGVRFDDWNFQDGAEYNPWLAYAQSKTANILFSSYLATMLKAKGVLVFALNPGFVTESKLMANVTPDMFDDGLTITMKALDGEEMPAGAMIPMNLAQGASTSLYAALDPSLSVHSGAFLTGSAVWTISLKNHATGEENQEKLWELSQKLVGENFAWN